MHRLVADGIRGKQLAAFKRVRKHQATIFLSCITNANGKTIDRDFLIDWRNNTAGSIGRHCSEYTFGAERPPASNWGNLTGLQWETFFYLFSWDNGLPPLTDAGDVT